MDFTHFLFGEAYLTAIGWTLAHSIWQIALISGLFWLVLTIIPKKASQKRYAAGLVALLTVFTASCWTLVDQLNGVKERQPERTYASVQMIQEPIAAHVYSPRSSDLFEEPLSLTYLAEKVESLLPYLVNLWVLGAIFYSVRLAGSIYDLQKLHRRHHESVSKLLLRKVDSLSAAMGLYQKVQVMKSTLVRTPATYGFIKPVILLPATLVFAISPAQLEAIIAHELAHIKRHDYLTNLLQSIMEVIFFFHPCFWWINNLIEEERENARDDLVLAAGISAKDLAFGLAEVANSSNSPVPDMALAASGSKHKTLQRIKRIMGKPISSPKLSPLIPITMIFALIVSAIFMVGAQEQGSKNNDALLLTHIKTHAVTWEEPTGVKIIQKRMIINQDTIPSKGQAKAPDLEEMPKLELTPVPKMDVEIPALPDIPPAPPAPVATFSFPNMDVKIQADSLGKMAGELQEIEGDNSPEAKQRRQTLKSAMAKVEQNIAELAKAFEVKMEAWQEAHGPAFEKFENEMRLWEEKMQEHQKSWESTFAPKMEEFEKKMKLWEAENSPKLKELEEKMKRWAEENELKFYD